jgi:hypothetical protein
MKKKTALYQWHHGFSGLSGAVEATNVGNAAKKIRYLLWSFGYHLITDHKTGGWKKLSIAFHSWAT